MMKQIKWCSFITPYNNENAEKATTHSGVYLLWVKLENGKWKCFYVGQAINIRNRLSEHLSINAENKCIKNNVSNFICGFEYAEVSNQSDRDNIEKFLYDHYKPKCNKISPPSETPQEVNLP
ncbi:GIY-YIG nuclease family protein [Flavobacteriaceae bacterium AH-315-B10]|nr:GIY-YIG nuclease family protein [Flavobacteriaceae bacterium AH-315-B10]